MTTTTSNIGTFVSAEIKNHLVPYKINWIGKLLLKSGILTKKDFEKVASKNVGLEQKDCIFLQI